MKSFSFSRIGSRERNEDRILEPVALPDGSSIAAVADGIGGSDDGAQAAHLAIQAIEQHAMIGDDVAMMFRAAKDALAQYSEQTSPPSRIGTTLSLCKFSESSLKFGHVGDCRIYLLRGEGLKTLTKDQTEIAELVEKGVFTRRQAKRYPRRGILTSALTSYSEYNLQEGWSNIQSGDRILLMSDGVYNSVNKRSMLDCSLQFPDISDFSRELESLVSSSAPTDNFSMVAIEI
jgi:protein phosphatase